MVNKEQSIHFSFGPPLNEKKSMCVSDTQYSDKMEMKCSSEILKEFLAVIMYDLYENESFSHSSRISHTFATLNYLHTKNRAMTYTLIGTYIDTPAYSCTYLISQLRGNCTMYKIIKHQNGGKYSDVNDFGKTPKSIQLVAAFGQKPFVKWSV